MTVSKKLALTQVFIYAISIISVIAFISLVWVNILEVIDNGSSTFLFAKKIFDITTLWWIPFILFLILTVAGFVIGIIQIVYKAKEQTSGVYLAAGICAILSLSPLMGIVTLILNIIGLTIKK